MAKIMKEPELAAAMQKPQVMKAIMVRKFQLKFSFLSLSGDLRALFLAAFALVSLLFFFLSVFAFACSLPLFAGEEKGGGGTKS